MFHANSRLFLRDGKFNVAEQPKYGTIYIGYFGGCKPLDEMQPRGGLPEKMKTDREVLR
ncbi:hypothetical protein PAECIP111802_01071 [Paenibacillus allorhizosphaerae]|uniref:Uncharacterized protein n=1 Tax=Paenibacillus allorhizosphaerae TaxID=2849866 RepID=A0ABM8VCP3_9BACL|nr:hypothetical protein PAECIP111802_01071 [Paenibacillus allorhizosphaerae]